MERTISSTNCGPAEVACSVLEHATAKRAIQTAACGTAEETRAFLLDRGLSLDTEITVCAECNRACCWQGEFMCEDADIADIKAVTLDQLVKLRDIGECNEHPEYWLSAAEICSVCHKNFGECGCDEEPHEDPAATYDAEIAPALALLGERCTALGFHLVARVEYRHGEAGLTTHTDDPGISVAQRLTAAAASANGNIDSLILFCLKHFDCSSSIVLAPHQRSYKETME